MTSRDPYKYFRIEARELQENLRRTTDELAGVDDAARVARLLRLAHTLKGAARVVRLPAISDLAHRIEDVLAPFRDSADSGAAEKQVELRQLIEGIAGHLAEIDRPATAPARPADGASPTSAVLDAVSLQMTEVESALSGVADTSLELAALRQECLGLDRACEQARTVAALTARARLPAGRISIETGELSGKLEGLRRRMGRRVERIDRDLQRLHADTSRLRLIPVDVLWAYLERAARDAAQAVGKAVRLETWSATPRIDAPVFSIVQEALQHLVRNAVVHGVEPAAARTAAGKRAEGLVRLRIEHESGRLRIVCADDGGGVDVDAVRRAAAAKGKLPAGAAAPLAMDDAVALLLKGGLSTSGTIDEMSGRGIGLEVVTTAVGRLRGGLTVESESRRGTTVTLELPVAFAAVDVLAVASGDVQWLLPVASVRRVVRTEPGAIHGAGDGEELNDAGQAIPYAAIRRLSGRTGRLSRDRLGKITAVIVQGRDGLAAIGVDRLLGTCEAVVRPLPALARPARFIVGAALDSGRLPRLLVDANELAEAVRRTRAEVSPALAVHAPVLVVDDSLTTRMLEQSILESAGYQVDVAVSGEEALERLHRRRYGLVLVDVEMPGMDGFTLVERLRAEPEWKGIPAILVSSRESREDRARGLQAGAQDYVAKGEFDQRRLLGRIAELLT
ncbi:MAG: response regulator [Opitutae bacterium]|nr:response regulator [Opitutae bacterium]